jgi:hypothetical protein
MLIDMSLNASGVRDTARVLHISTDTVLNELRKKAAALESVHTAKMDTRCRLASVARGRSDSLAHYHSDA